MMSDHNDMCRYCGHGDRMHAGGRDAQGPYRTCWVPGCGCVQRAEVVQ